MVVGREFWETFVSLSDNQLHYLISYALAFVAFGLIRKWYLWPVLKGRTPRTAFTPLLLCAIFRVNKLMFLIPTLVSTQLQNAFANTFVIAGCSNFLRRTATGGIKCAQWS